MTKNKINKLGTVGFAKTIELQRLIDELNNTTVGTLSNDVSTLQTQVSTLIGQMNTLLNHTHTYTDTTISDTADGSGTASSTTKTTGGIS